MKAEDFLIALNDADDAYVKKAGLKGGYLSMHSEASIQKTEQSGTTRNLRQETAKQRSVKRVWLAAACLALVAVSCGAWMLLKDRLALSGSREGASVGTSPSQIVSAATEKPAPTEGEAPTEEDSIHWVNAHLSFTPGTDTDLMLYAAFDKLEEDPLVSRADFPECSRHFDGTGRELIERECSQNNLLSDYYQLSEQEPEKTVIIQLWYYVVFDHTKTDLPDAALYQILYLVEEDGSWVLFDSTFPQASDREIPKSAEEKEAEEYAELLHMHTRVGWETISFSPGSDPFEVLQQAFRDRQEEGTVLSYSLEALYDTITIDKETLANDLGLDTLTQQASVRDWVDHLMDVNTIVIPVKYSIQYDPTRVSAPDLAAFTQYFCLCHMQDGSWIALDATYPVELSSDEDHAQPEAEMTAEEVVQWISEQLHFAPTDNVADMLRAAAAKLEQDEYVSVCNLSHCVGPEEIRVNYYIESARDRLLVIFGGNDARLKEALQAKGENFAEYDVVYTVQFDPAMVSCPDVKVFQKLFFVRLEDGTWELFQATELKQYDP